MVYGIRKDKIYDCYLEQFINGNDRFNSFWRSKPTPLDFIWNETGIKVKTIAIFKIRFK